VPINSYDDGNSGQTWLSIPASAPSKFPGGCMPLTVNIPINAGAGTISNAALLLDPKSGSNVTTPLGDPDHDGIWTGTITCVATGDLYVLYDLTEDGNTQSFSVPVGGLVLIDPAGTVYDKDTFDALKASGHSDSEARAGAAISGASVRLQRCATALGDCTNVLSGDPGISPHVNPELTGADGQYQWDVSSGYYRVLVTKVGYDTVTAPILSIPPPVTDAHVAMKKTAAPPPSDTGGGTPTAQAPAESAGTPGAPPSPIPVTPAGIGGTTPSKPCAGLKGSKRTKCLDAQKLKAALAKCDKQKGKKRAACKKKVRALAKCDKLKGKKRTGCRKRASSPPRSTEPNGNAAGGARRPRNRDS
jgi:hypothetical protein